MTDGDSLGSRATPVPMTGPSLTPIEVAGVSLGWNSMSERASEDYDFKDSKGIFDRYADEHYFEAQIKGGVTLSDVAAIHIPNRDGDFYRNLVDTANERGVEVVKYEA